LWPVDVAPSKDFTEKQEAAKVEIQKDAAQGEQLTQEAQAITQEAKNVSTRLETRKKGITKAKEKANESEVKVDFVAHGDVADVPGNAELCTRANQAGIRCDTDR
jgi:NADPH-dependent ferric siderophore reductase